MGPAGPREFCVLTTESFAISVGEKVSTATQNHTGGHGGAGRSLSVPRGLGFEASVRVASHLHRCRGGWGGPSRRSGGFRELKGRCGKRQRLALCSGVLPGRTQTSSEDMAPLLAPIWEDWQVTTRTPRTDSWMGWGAAFQEQVLDLSWTSGWTQGPPTPESTLARCWNH